MGQSLIYLKVGLLLFGHSNCKYIFITFNNQQTFSPIAQLYNLHSWPLLRHLSPAHVMLLFVISLSLAVAGCLAYPLGHRTVGLLMWLVSSLIVCVLAVPGAAIMVKRRGKEGLGRIKTRA
eukprot:GFUD01087607.1.p1 GENE.GFUD01087607.1~~GFUD01087607.1.p1  ORF type:complete len:135 (-),score=25.19 GFUD01087607.1:61-423(-)